MANQRDIVNPESPGGSGCHGNIDDDFEEYIEEEMHEDSKEEVFEEVITDGTASEVSDGSYEEIIEEESCEEPEEEPSEEVWLKGSQNPVYVGKDKNAPSIRFPESENSPNLSSDKRPMNPSNLSTDANNKLGVAGSSRQKRHSRWDIKADTPLSVTGNDGNLTDKRRKTRWSSDEAPAQSLDAKELKDSVILHLAGINDDRTMQKLYAKLQVIKEKLESGPIVDKRPERERSPSPPPVYDVLGNRINTREFRLRSKLVKQQQKIVKELLNMSKQGKSKPTPEILFCKKVYIPIKEYPSYNFVGLILGPRGNSLKAMEKETGAVIKLRGKGSNFKEKKIEDCKDDLHVLIEADNQVSLDAAVAMVEKLLIPVEDGQNHYKAAQLRELAALNGSLKGQPAVDPCDVCGSSSHITSNCPLTVTASEIKPNFSAASGSLFSSFRNQRVSPNPLPLDTKPNEEKPIKSNDNSKFPAVSGSLFSSIRSQNASPFPLLLETMKHEENPNEVVDDPRFPTVSGSYFSSFRTQNVSPVPLPFETKKHNVVGGSNFPAVSGSLFYPFRSGNVASTPLPLDTKVQGEKLKNLVDVSNLPGSLFTSFSSQNVSPGPVPSENRKHGEKPKKVIDDSSLFVGSLPFSVDDHKLMELFLPYGKLCDVKVLRDRNTGQRKGCGFVKYATADEAAKAIAHMDGYWLEGRKLTVRVAGIPPTSANAFPPPLQASTLSSQCIVPASSELASFPGFLKSIDPPNQVAPLRPSTSVAVRTSTELASFPGFLKSIDPPYQIAPSCPSASVAVPVSSELANFPGFLKSIDIPIHNPPLGPSTSFGSAFQASTSSSRDIVPASSELDAFPSFLTSSNPSKQSFPSMPPYTPSLSQYFSRNPFQNQPTGR